VENLITHSDSLCEISHTIKVQWGAAAKQPALTRLRRANPPIAPRPGLTL